MRALNSTTSSTVAGSIRRRLHRLRRARRPVRLLVRSPALLRTGAAALGAVALTALATTAADLDRRERRLGPMSDVLISVGDHRAGDRLAGPDVRTVRIPDALVPTGALTSLPPTARLAADVGEGEILVGHRLAGERLGRLASMIPEDWRAIGLPLPAGSVPFAVGDRVDVLGPGSDGRPTLLSEAAVVIDADPEAVVVALARSDVGPVAETALAATVTVVLRGG